MIKDIFQKIQSTIKETKASKAKLFIHQADKQIMLTLKNENKA